MTASALLHERAEALTFVSYHGGIDGGPWYADLVADDVSELHSLLLAVADVVEAAEEWEEYRENVGMMRVYAHVPERLLADALTALRDALQAEPTPLQQAYGGKVRTVNTDPGSPPPPEGATAPTPDPRLVVRKSADGAALEGDTP